MIRTFTDNARAAGPNGVVAPVRPTWKERYPLIPIERYVGWRSDDGTHFDPWLRIHELVGGEIMVAAPRSMTITWLCGGLGGVDRHALPRRRPVRLPGGLAPLVVREGVGTHVEPNVWMIHQVAPEASARRPYGGKATRPSSTTTRPSRSSEWTASASSARADAPPRPPAGASRRDAGGTSPRTGPCLRTGSTRIPRDGAPGAQRALAAAGMRARQTVAPRSISA